MNAPQRPPRKTGWNTYYPWLLGLSATLSGVALVFIGISWIPLQPVPGVPPSALSGPYLPGGLTILFAVLAGRQIFLRHQNGRVASINPGDSVGSQPTGGPDASAPARVRPDPASAQQRERGVGSWRIVGIAATGAAALLVLLLMAGFSSGYSYSVVDQEARSATTYEAFVGTYSLVEGGGQLCGVGDDYYACVEMHRTMFNSVCADRPLNALARERCDRLSAFVTEAQARYASCGYGCKTAGAGTCGWSLQTLEADTVTRSIDAVLEISHEERRDFDLGIVRFGQCPGRDG